MRVIEHSARHRHLGVFQDRIPACLLLSNQRRTRSPLAVPAVVVT
jgi:hypothetical protein